MSDNQCLLKVNMVFNGKQLAQEILGEIKKETADWKTKPTVAVLSLGDKADNSSYIKQKKRNSAGTWFWF